MEHPERAENTRNHLQFVKTWLIMLNWNQLKNKPNILFSTRSNLVTKFKRTSISMKFDITKNEMTLSSMALRFGAAILAVIVGQTFSSFFHAVYHELWWVFKAIIIVRLTIWFSNCHIGNLSFKMPRTWFTCTTPK